jgi:hypothetical protein
MRAITEMTAYRSRLAGGALAGLWRGGCYRRSCIASALAPLEVVRGILSAFVGGPRK